MIPGVGGGRTKENYWGGRFNYDSLMYFKNVHKFHNVPPAQLNIYFFKCASEIDYLILSFFLFWQYWSLNSAGALPVWAKTPAIFS
jgi:hypothetical protein